MDDLLSEFLTETSENLATLDLELVRLEQNPNDPELLSNIFRLVHTIKGTCGFLGLPRLETVAHASENVLGKFREGELEVTPDAVSLILEALDTIKWLLSVLEQTEREPDGDDADLVARLESMAAGNVNPSQTAAAAPPPSPAGEDDDDDFELEAFDGAADEDAFDDADDSADSAAPAESPPPIVDVDDDDDDEPAPPARPAGPPAKAATPPAPVAAEPAGDNGKREIKESAVANQTIRVSVDVLENLMTMVSELVLNRNQLLQILRKHKESEFAAPLQRLNHVTSELQEGVMKTRMQPIGNAWAKLPRLIRDLSQEAGKKIELQMVGAETELDRQVLDLIKDPLTHMIRNSADHGIEKPEDRVRAGKSEHGRVRLHAYHEGGHIIIVVTDDGKGIAVEKVKAKALQNGLCTEAELAAMTDQQIQQLIFRAGLSTAEKVTNVSGRGVGMDVVKTNIEKIGGTVELKSIEGRGSTFMIKIPLTLAIVSALIVECGGERFAIPQISVLELVRSGGHSEQVIERINNTPVLRLRNRLLPLVSLRQLLRLPPAEDGVESEAFIVVSQVGTYTFGIIVDRVFDTEEIVVKPVAPILRHIEMFSGNTILGDGSVIMILDPNGIAAATGEISVAEGVDHMSSQKKRRSSSDEKTSLLLFRAGSGAPKAVPLALVARLEDIELDKVETSSGQMMVQYRGRLMPLIPFDPSFHLGSVGANQNATVDEGEEARMPVLVFADGERAMGLIVDEILDIVEEHMSVELGSNGSGLLGSAIIAGKATDVIDAGHYLVQAYRDWFGSQSEALSESTQHRILLVDDSPFFRNMLTPLLSVAGYDVTAVASASEALALCEQGEDFDAIVSDIEMPGMNGFDFAKTVRANGRWQTVPLVALSSHATQRDLERGRQAGFTDYVAKFDRDALLVTLAQTLSEARGAA